MDSRLNHFGRDKNHLLHGDATDENIISTVTLCCCVISNAKIGNQDSPPSYAV